MEHANALFASWPAWPVRDQFVSTNIGPNNKGVNATVNSSILALQINNRLGEIVASFSVLATDIDDCAQ